MRINLLEDYKNIIFKLNDDIRTDAPMNPTDIFNTKINLNRLGYYPKPDFGITKYTDEGLFSGLKNFQKDNNLKVDGIMRIGGETETTMREKITLKNRDRYSNNNQTSYRNKINSYQSKQDIKQNTQTKTEKIVKYRFEAKGSNSCDECMQYDGQIFDKKEDAPKLPIHPNCNCKLHEVVSHKNIEVKSEEIISKDYKIRGNDSFGSGEFGSSRDGNKRKHAGVDIISKPGEKVKVISNGKVIKINSPYGDGIYKGVDVRTEDGRKERYFYIDPSVKPGDEIKKGDILGTTQDIAKKYNRKNAKMTNHYHYEVRDKKGKPIDPTKKIHLL